jgi:hypothetical protein
MMNAQQLRLNVEWNAKEEKERMLDFGMAHQSILFQVNKISSKVMVGHQKQNERAEN